LRDGGHKDFRFGDTLLFPPVEVDQTIGDGQSIELGGQKLTAWFTPGHTKGNTTWTTKISDSGKTYDVVFAGSPTVLDYRFVGKESYPGIIADFEKTFAVLKKCRATFSFPITDHFFLSTKNANVWPGAKIQTRSLIPMVTNIS
jgi:metallo-beta-lactamase class B